MRTKRRTLVVAGLLLLAFIAVIIARPAPPPGPAPAIPGSFDFAVLGDAPYHPWEELQYNAVLKDLDAHDLAFVIHVGDIFWRPCSDAMYRKTLDGFNSIRHAVIYTPGDNEWTDCWQRAPGGYPPLDRLQRIREIFFANPHRSLGGAEIDLRSQADSDSFAEFVENARWSKDGFVFATLHLVGSRNATEPFRKRTPADDEAARARTEAVVAWLRETFAEAESTRAAGVVLAFHANPAFEESTDDDYRGSYEPFLTALEEETEKFARPVLVVQGDDHEFVVDRPLVRRTTGERLENFRRLQVPGSPDVGWVRVTVTPGAAEPFTFENRALPRWKYW